MRIRRSGLWRTDLLVCDGVYKGRNRPIPSALVLGHEASGRCSRYNLCPDWHHIGLTTAGALAEFAVVPATSLLTGTKEGRWQHRPFACTAVTLMSVTVTSYRSGLLRPGPPI